MSNEDFRFQMRDKNLFYGVWIDKFISLDNQDDINLINEVFFPYNWEYKQNKVNESTLSANI